MKQTATEWLFEQLRNLAHNSNAHLGMGDIRVTQGYIDEIEEQAKAMEKEQIISVYWDAYKEGLYFEDKTADEYYKETFKQE